MKHLFETDEDFLRYLNGLPHGGRRVSSQRYDPYSILALKIYGEVTPTGRRKAKEISYIRAYGGNEISVGCKTGQFPTADYTLLELRALSFLLDKT